MEMWFIFLVGLVGQGLATQVNYQSSSSAQSSSAASSNQQEWSWQGDQAGASSKQEDSFHPLSFSASDAVPQQQVEQEQHQVFEVGSSVSDQTSDLLSEQSVRVLSNYNKLYFPSFQLSWLKLLQKHFY